MKNVVRGIISINLAICLLLVASCGKNNDPKPASKKLYSMIETGAMGVTNFTFQYNSEGKLEKLASSRTQTNSFSSSTTYVYSANQITEKQNSIETDGQSFSQSWIYKLNSQGYVSKKAKADSNYSIEYIYNDNGNLISATGKDGNTITSVTLYTWADGNLISETRTYPGNNSSYTTTHEYYTDKPNSYTTDNIGMSYFGKSGKNQIKKTIINSGSSVLTYTSTYEFDSDNYVTKETKEMATVGNNSNSYVTTYVWK